MGAVCSAFLALALGAGDARAWTGDAERARTEEWPTALSCASDSRVAQATDPVAQLARSYRIEVRDGDDYYGERCELANKKQLYPEGSERWIAFQVYLPSGYPISTTRWNAIQQLKHDGTGGPALGFSIRGGKLLMTNSKTNEKEETWQVDKGAWPITTGRWLKLTWRVKFSSGPAVGYTELYGDLDGAGQKLLLPRTAMHTLKQSGGKSLPSFSRTGIYRDKNEPGNATLYYDGYSVAATKEQAETNSFGSSTN